MEISSNKQAFIISWSKFGGFPDDCGKESACSAGDPGSIPGLGRSLGGGNGNPLQLFYLGNPMDREVWWATVHEVTKSWTRLSNQACMQERAQLIWDNQSAEHCGKCRRGTQKPWLFQGPWALSGLWFHCTKTFTWLVPYLKVTFQVRRWIIVFHLLM